MSPVEGPPMSLSREADQSLLALRLSARGGRSELVCVLEGTGDALYERYWEAGRRLSLAARGSAAPHGAAIEASSVPWAPMPMFVLESWKTAGEIGAALASVLLADGQFTLKALNPTPGKGFTEYGSFWREFSRVAGELSPSSEADSRPGTVLKKVPPRHETAAALHVVYGDRWPPTPVAKEPASVVVANAAMGSAYVACALLQLTSTTSNRLDSLDLLTRLLADRDVASSEEVKIPNGAPVIVVRLGIGATAHERVFCDRRSGKDELPDVYEYLGRTFAEAVALSNYYFRQFSTYRLFPHRGELGFYLNAGLLALERRNAKGKNSPGIESIAKSLYNGDVLSCPDDAKRLLGNQIADRWDEELSPDKLKRILSVSGALHVAEHELVESETGPPGTPRLGEGIVQLVIEQIQREPDLLGRIALGDALSKDLMPAVYEQMMADAAEFREGGGTWKEIGQHLDVTASAAQNRLDPEARRRNAERARERAKRSDPPTS